MYDFSEHYKSSPFTISLHLSPLPSLSLPHSLSLTLSLSFFPSVCVYKYWMLVWVNVRAVNMYDFSEHYKSSPFTISLHLSPLPLLPLHVIYCVTEYLKNSFSTSTILSQKPNTSTRNKGEDIIKIQSIMLTQPETGKKNIIKV